MTGVLRIGVNALYLIPGEVGGSEIDLRSLLDELARIDCRNEYFIYVNTETGSALEAASPHLRIIPCRVKARFRPFRIIWEQTALPWLLQRDKVNVLLNPGFTGPLLFANRSVTVFHDLQHKKHPEFFRRLELPFWNLLLWCSATRSRALIAVSAATADDLVRYYRGAAARTAVIHHGVDSEFFRIGERRFAAGALREPLILTVCTLHPHKNLVRLMEAFQAFRTSHPEFRMAIAGLRGFASEQLEIRRRTLGLEEFVTFTGWIPRSELYELFERASAYIAPSEFEGFGMPLLEALAAGIPCACSDIPPFDEVAADVAARFDPDSAPAITRALETIACDDGFRARAATDGPAQARRFSWKRAAALTLKELEKAA